MFMLLLCYSDFSVCHVTATNAAPPVRVMCTGASTATMTVRTPSISVALTGILGLNDVLLLAPMILMDAVMDVAGFTVLLQQQLHSQLSVITRAYAHFGMGSVQGEFFSFTVVSPTNISAGVSCGVYFPFSGSDVAIISTNGAEPLGFGSLQCF